MSGFTYQLARDEANAPVRITIERDGVGVTGLTVTAALRDLDRPDGGSGPYYLDWNDMAMKDSGWTTQFQSLSEIGGGLYELVDGLDIGALNSGAGPDSSVTTQALIFSWTGGIVGTDEDTYSYPASVIWDAVAADHTASGSLALELQNKAEPGDEMGLTAATVVSLVDDVWDESMIGHAVFASAAYYLTNMPGFVWAYPTSSLVTAGSVGELVDLNLDAPVSDAATSAEVTASVWGLSEAALLAAGEAGALAALFLSRNTFIDFVGNDALGWQAVTNNSAGAEIGRANLFDETGSRITGTIADFVAAQHTIARTTPL